MDLRVRNESLLMPINMPIVNNHSLQTRWNYID